MSAATAPAPRFTVAHNPRLRLVEMFDSAPPGERCSGRALHVNYIDADGRDYYVSLFETLAAGANQSMGLAVDKAHESPSASTAKASPTAGGVTAPGVSPSHLRDVLREALTYIGECPHHVFRDPKKVVAFYERATAASKVQP